MTECGWNDCTEEATEEVQLDAGESVCTTCGTTKTNKTNYALCETHGAQYRETSDNNVLMANATPEGMA